MDVVGREGRGQRRMVVSKGAAAESGMVWMQSWAGVSSGVGVAVDFGRGHQQIRGWGGSGFR